MMSDHEKEKKGKRKGRKQRKIGWEEEEGGG